MGVNGVGVRGISKTRREVGYRTKKEGGMYI